jgi:gamma-butyrobetaine dioxygenase
MMRATCGRRPLAGVEMTSLKTIEVIEDGRALALRRADGRRLRFHAIWLRDNALDDSTRSPQNGQRLVTLQQIPADTRITAASLQGAALQVTFAPEQRSTRFPLTWLWRHGYDGTPARESGWTAPEIET